MGDEINRIHGSSSLADIGRTPRKRGIRPLFKGRWTDGHQEAEIAVLENRKQNGPRMRTGEVDEADGPLKIAAHIIKDGRRRFHSCSHLARPEKFLSDVG